MTVFEFLMGDGSALRDAERRLRDSEDRVFRPVTGEEHNLALHVRADLSRFDALNARQRLGQARAERKADATLLVSIAGFALVLAKLFGGFDLVVQMLMQL